MKCRLWWKHATNFLVMSPPNATIWYIDSDMILHIHIDASYLSEQNSKSHVYGNFYLTSTNDTTPSNGTILTLSAIIKNVVFSAAEAELTALFYNCKDAIPLHITLEELGPHQPPTAVITEFEAAHGLLHTLMTSKHQNSWTCNLIG